MHQSPQEDSKNAHLSVGKMQELNLLLKVKCAPKMGSISITWELIKMWSQAYPGPCEEESAFCVIPRINPNWYTTYSFFSTGQNSTS